jgi:hypothetical protein
MIHRLQDLQILNWGCCRSVSPEVSGWRHTSLFDDETGYVTPLKTANNKNILSRIPQLSGASNRNEFFPQTSLNAFSRLQFYATPLSRDRIGQCQIAAMHSGETFAGDLTRVETS